MEDKAQTSVQITKAIKDKSTDIKVSSLNAS